MPPGTFQSTDTDIAALVEANLAFGGTVAKPSTPQAYARVFADVDYVAGAYNTHTRWLGIDGAAQEGGLIARHELRSYMGIADTTPSQAVVDTLLTVSRAPNNGALLAALSSPVFGQRPEVTLAKLQNVPDFFSTPNELKRLNRASGENKTGCGNNFFC